MVVENAIDRKPLNAEKIYVDSLVETIKRRLLRGGGFAWIPETAISAELAAGSVIPVGNEDWCTSMSISALSNPSALDHTALEFWDRL